MKTYEELLSDIEDDIELMGASHIVYSMEENNVITDYDYLPSDSCNISTTLKELQETIHQQMLYAKVTSHLTEADKNTPRLAVIFQASVTLRINRSCTTPAVLQRNTAIRFILYPTATSREISRTILSKGNRLLSLRLHRQNRLSILSTGPPTAASFLFPKVLVLPSLLPMQPNII